MSVRGIFTSDANIEGTRKKDFASAILMIMPQGTAPLLALSSGMQGSDLRETITTWFEENYLSGRITHTTNLAGTTAAGAEATITGISDANQVVEGQIYLVEATGEHLYVSSVSGSTIKMQRGFAGTTVAANDGSTTAQGLQRLGSAHEEASDRPVAIANRGTARFNAIQTFRNSWNVSGLAQQISYIGGSIEQKSIRDCTIEHAADIERSLIWGRYSFGLRNMNNFTTMHGLQAQIKDNEREGNSGVKNVVKASGAVTYTNFRNWLQTIYEKNVKGKPNERIGFCGNGVLNALDDIVRATGSGEVQLRVGQTDYGFNVRKLITPYGTISLMTHPMMVESPMWTNELFLFHPGVTELRWVRRQVWDNYNTTGSRGGKDADYGVVTSDLTICYKAAVTGGIYTNIKSGA